MDKLSLNAKLNNYKMVDVVKYLTAVMVICIHCSAIFPQEQLNFLIKNVVCRIAVPFFCVSSAYFVRKGSFHQENYLKKYIKTLGKTYFIWSLIFIPLGILWINEHLKLSGFAIILAFIFGLIQVGTYYHLWYIPALIFSLYFIDKSLKYVSYKIMFVISTLLFVFGSLETYYGILPQGVLKDTFDAVIHVFFTTRTGLLFGSIFVVTGYFIYDYQKQLSSLLKYVPSFTVLCGALLVAEGFFLYNVERLDMNFLLMLVPFSFFFFLWILSFPKEVKVDTRKIRELSKYYYFIHPVCVLLIEEMGEVFKVVILQSGVISYVLIILLTHFLSTIIIELQKKSWNYSWILSASFLGMLVTVMVEILFFLFKVYSIEAKVEIAPCLWFISSLMIYFLLFKNQKLFKVLI